MLQNEIVFYLTELGVDFYIFQNPFFVSIILDLNIFLCEFSQI